MPNLRKIIVKKTAGQRGTEDKEGVLELATAEWDSIRENCRQSDQLGDLISHFNSVSGDIGDTLFGDSSTIDEFVDLINGLDEEVQKEFVRAWNDVFEQEK